jgi:hypothetical protein
MHVIIEHVQRCINLTEKKIVACYPVAQLLSYLINPLSIYVFICAITYENVLA